VTEEYDQSEIKTIIGLCDFFVGSRMHACIAALSQGIPTVALAYSPKFLGVFQSVDVGDMVLDARQLNLEDLLDECIARFENRQLVAKHLQKVIPRIQDEINAKFQRELLPNRLEDTRQDQYRQVVATVR